MKKHNNKHFMKHNGNNSHFKHMRNTELMRAFRQVVKEQPFFDVSCDFELVVNQPCSRFWVSEERATAVVSAMLRGLPVTDIMRPTKKEMFEEILSRVKGKIQECPNIALCGAVFFAVNSPAPKFYMEPLYAREIIYKIKRKEAYLRQ